MECLPGEWRPQPGTLGEQLEENRGPGAGRPADDERGIDAFPGDLRVPGARFGEEQPRPQAAQDLLTRHEAPERVQTRFLLDRLEQQGVGLPPRVGAEILETERAGRGIEQLFGVEAHEVARIRHGIAHRVQPAHPVGSGVVQCHGASRAMQRSVGCYRTEARGRASGAASLRQACRDPVGRMRGGRRSGEATASLDATRAEPKTPRATNPLNVNATWNRRSNTSSPMTSATSPLTGHSRESGNPCWRTLAAPPPAWVPAFAGTTI